MSDDLVKRLRQGGTYQHDTVPMQKAADRIEQLEAALREISHLNNMRDRFSSEIDAIITRVVEKKDD